jgi:hypothetical protein
MCQASSFGTPAAVPLISLLASLKSPAQTVLQSRTSYAISPLPNFLWPGAGLTRGGLCYRVRIKETIRADHVTEIVETSTLTSCLARKELSVELAQLDSRALWHPDEHPR